MAAGVAWVIRAVDMTPTAMPAFLARWVIVGGEFFKTQLLRTIFLTLSLGRTLIAPIFVLYPDKIAVAVPALSGT